MDTSRRRLRALAAAALVLAVAAPPALAAPSARDDFDGDGFADLAIGAPEDSVADQPRAGAVNVLYGSRGGLTAAGDQQFTKRPQRIAGMPAPGARFGAALASGDLDGDGYADLAIGAPGEDAGGLEQQPESGAVTVLYGSSSGLRPRPQVGSWSQNSVGVKGNAEAGDAFGAALAIGDLDGDGRAELAIGAPGDSVDGQAEAGAVHVLYGRPRGLTARGDDLWTQATGGVKGVAGAGHRFGAALAAGDVSDDGRADLAIGIPGGVIGGDTAGAVAVLYGRAGGLSAVDDLWSEDAEGVQGSADPNDRFGRALAIGDFDGDGAGDLAVGAPIATVGGAAGAGSVHLLFGSGSGLRAARDQLWTQGSAGVGSMSSIGETFGAALAAGDFSRNGVDDLAVGTPGEQVDGAVAAGAVTVLYGGRGKGLRASASRLLSQATPGIGGGPEEADLLGDALAAADFDGDGDLDLAVAAPDDSVGGFARAGAVIIVEGSSRGLRPARSRLWTQSTSGVLGAVGSDRFGAALSSGR